MIFIVYGRENYTRFGYYGLVKNLYNYYVQIFSSLVRAETFGAIWSVYGGEAGPILCYE